MAEGNPVTDVYVMAAHRTAMGSYYGQFNGVTASMLGSAAMKTCLDELHLRCTEINHIIMGQVATSDLGPNPAGRTAELARIPSYVGSLTINMECASGLKAVLEAYNAIKSASATVVVCGGQENVTMAPQTMNIPPEGSPSVSFPMHVCMLVDDLSDGFTGVAMRERANQLAEEYKISRATQDEYAYDSMQKANKAMKANHFKQEIVRYRGCFRDETIYKRLPLTLEALKHQPTLLDDTPGKPSTVTDGNSALACDGAAALVLCNGMESLVMRKAPLAQLVGFSQVLTSPDYWGIGSIASISEVLKTTGWTKESIDLFEIQEVFAVQTLIVINQLQIDPLKVNISGGAIALGHPVGASSTRMLVTLIYNLRRLNLKRGIASACTGKGQAIAVAVQTMPQK